MVRTLLWKLLLLLLLSVFRSILAGLGEDPDREGLKDTPKRAAKALAFFTKGEEHSYKLLASFLIYFV